MTIRELNERSTDTTLVNTFVLVCVNRGFKVWNVFKNFSTFKASKKNKEGIIIRFELEDMSMRLDEELIVRVFEDNSLTCVLKLIDFEVHD